METEQQQPELPAEHRTKYCRCKVCTARRRAAKADHGAAGSYPKYARNRKNHKAVTSILDDGNTPLVLSSTNTLHRSRVEKWLAWRATEPGITNQEIANRLEIHLNTLRASLAQGTKEGWLQPEGALERLEYELIPKIVDNLNHFLDKKDKTTTLECAKGTIFKDYQAERGMSDQPTTVLALKIEAVDPGNMRITTGEIVGAPLITVGKED